MLANYIICNICTLVRNIFIYFPNYKNYVLMFIQNSIKDIKGQYHVKVFNTATV